MDDPVRMDLERDVSPRPEAPTLPLDVRLLGVRDTPRLRRGPVRRRGAQRRAIEHHHRLQDRPHERNRDTARRPTARADMSDAAETVVIGLGNVILSDDGLGVHAVRRLRDRCPLADRVELIEGGTAGLLLLPHLADARRAIIIDAIDTGAPPGTLVRLPGEDWASTYAIRITPPATGPRHLP